MRGGDGANLLFGLRLLMSSATAIEWTDATWNPVTGCDKVSPGCDRCYAMTLAPRLKAMGSAKYQNDGDPPKSGPGFKLTVHPASLDEPRKWRAGRNIFVCSMSDLFHPSVPLSFIKEVFAVAEDTPRHRYQVLTKRAQRAARLAGSLEWPNNLWMGTSVENSRYRFRVDHLRNIPAAVRFVSAEPLLGPIPRLNLEGVHWLIVGGESGVGARPMEERWAADLRDQALAAGVAFFFKQWGGRTPKAGGRELEGRLWEEMP